MALNIIENEHMGHKETFEKLLEQNQMSLKGRSAILEQYKNKKLYLEWGSGGSTLWHVQQVVMRNLKTQIISVEHSSEWYSQVKSAIKNYLSPTEEQFLYLHKPVETADLVFKNKDGNAMKLNLISSPWEETTSCMTDYIDPPEIELEDVDVFLVDGLARGACLSTIREYAKENAIIFLHDIDGREEWYNWALKFFANDYDTHYEYHNLIRLQRKH